MNDLHVTHDGIPATIRMIEELLTRYMPYSGGRLIYKPHGDLSDTWHFKTDDNMGEYGTTPHKAYWRFEAYALLFAMGELRMYAQQHKACPEIEVYPDGFIADDMGENYMGVREVNSQSPAVVALLLLCHLAEAQA